MITNTKSILGNTRCADISFFPSGKIDISSRIVKALEMKAGDVIDIMVADNEFYLYVSVNASEICGRHQARCYPSKRGSRHFRTYCRRLCSAMIGDHKSARNVSFAAGDVVIVNGRRSISIITRNAINHD